MENKIFGTAEKVLLTAIPPRPMSNIAAGGIPFLGEWVEVVGTVLVVVMVGLVEGVDTVPTVRRVPLRRDTKNNNSAPWKLSQHEAVSKFLAICWAAHSAASSSCLTYNSIVYCVTVLYF